MAKLKRQVKTGRVSPSKRENVSVSATLGTLDKRKDAVAYKDKQPKVVKKTVLNFNKFAE